MKKAFVDLNTGEIVGAKKGTRQYFHEEGHLKYHKTEKGMRNSFREQMTFQFGVYIAVLSFILPTLKYIAVIVMTISFYYFYYEEKWCWKYADNKLKGGKE